MSGQIKVSKRNSHPATPPTGFIYKYWIGSTEYFKTDDGIEHAIGEALTIEQVQDLLSTSFIDSSTINFTYDDTNNVFFANVIENTTQRFTTDVEKAYWDSKENAIAAGGLNHYFRGDKTFQVLDRSAVGLGSVDNTADINKPVSIAQQLALNAKADKSTTISAGAGLVGGGDLSANRSIALADTGITAGSYSRPVFTVDAKGRITAIRERLLANVESFTQSSSSIAIFSTYISLSFTALIAGNHKFSWTALFRHAATNNSPILDILLNGTSIYPTTFASQEELSDSTTGENIRRSGVRLLNLAVGANTIDLVFRPESNGTTMTMLDASMIIEEL